MEPHSSWIHAPRTRDTSSYAGSKSQTQRILDHLKRGFSITGMDALEKFDCWSLPKRISDIQKMGYTVNRVWVKTASGKKIKKYSIGVDK